MPAHRCMPRDPEEDDDALPRELTEEELEELEDLAGFPEEPVTSALVLRPKEPFLTWARTIEPDVPEEQRSACVVVLTPLLSRKAEVERWLRQHHAVVFEEQLAGWTPDESRWPDDRSLEAFRAWFEIDFAPVVDDFAHHHIGPDVSCEPISVDLLVERFDALPSGAVLFVDVTSGDPVSFTLTELDALETGDFAGLDLTAHAIDDLKRRYESSLVELLARDDFDELEVMRVFAEMPPIAGVRNRLTDAARSRKPFRRFKEAVDAAGLRRQWLEFRRETIALMLQSALDGFQIPYTSRTAGQS